MSNIHNKFVAIMLSVMMIVGCINCPVFAAVSKDKAVGNTAAIDISENPESIPVKDIKELSGRIHSIKDSSVKGISVVKKPKMRSMLQTETKDSAVNHPPVANLDAEILNPESLKNGQITTETEIAWLWSYGGQDFSYDPDGDAIIRDYSGIPKGYEIYELTDNTTGKQIGFVTKLSQARNYEMTFVVTDSKGASSSEPWFISVVTVEDYQSVDGTFNSKDDVQSYTIPIDFSKTPSVAFCLTRTDFGGVTADIKDSGGNIVSTLTVKGDKGRDRYSAKTWAILKKPIGTPDICEYTIDIKPKESDTGSYHFAVGGRKRY